MRLVSYYCDGLKVGVVRDDRVWDLRRAFELLLIEEEGDPEASALAAGRVPNDMRRFIQENHGRLERLEHSIARLEADESRHVWLRSERFVGEYSDTLFFPPILRPSKIANVGNSYRDHILATAEAHGVSADTPPSVKVSFLTASSAVSTGGAEIRYPANSAQWDYEGELGIVIGESCLAANREVAGRSIFGYTIFNDACIRDVPAVLGGWLCPQAKSSDTFAPMGPWIVTAEELGDAVNDLRIRVWVNEEIRQDASTSSLLWPVDEMVANISSFMQLYPGDVIATGSPAGVGLETGKYLRSGDKVRIEVQGIGVLENVAVSRALEAAAQPA